MSGALGGYSSLASIGDLEHRVACHLAANTSYR